jgi:CubicO group peptidase (beta-lactamase class C family)
VSDRATPAIDWMRARVTAGQLPTAVIGIATADRVVDIAAAGSDEAGDAHPDSRYCLYSVTKPLSGLAAMRAVERGLLTVDQTLGSLVPGAAAPQVTLGQLLSHTSGLSDVVLGSPSSLRESLLRAGLEFVPGTARRYNNIAWEGVAAMVEAVTDEPFTAQVEALARDAGATTLSFDAAGARPVYDADVVLHDHDTLMPLKHPAGGGVASVHDMLAIGQSLLRGDGAIVTPATVAAMRRPRTRGLYVIDPDPMKVHEDFGLAFNLPHRPGLIDHGWFGHDGWTSTQFWISPSVGVVLVLLSNRFESWRPDVGVAFDQLRNIVTTAFG